MVSIDEIDAILPQTQCTRCGYQGCRPYAEAIVQANAATNRCPPGGLSVLSALNRLMGQQHIVIDPNVGRIEAPKVAIINPDACIGCAKCLPACPVDAILGARQALHVVITDECSGCGLCLPPCPVDCIEMIDHATEPLTAERIESDAKRYRKRFNEHNDRLRQRRHAKEQRLAKLT